MEIILHRINQIELLKETSQNYGVEIDIRTFGENLIINHEPFQSGDLFKDWIKNFNHKTLILNIKEEGLEEEILFYLNKYSINTYFFLDQSFPSLMRNKHKINYKYSLRVSDYESIETAFKFKDKVDWIWLDVFHEFIFTKKDILNLKNNNFKICLSSPELNNTSKVNIESIKKIIKRDNIEFDAVCTKYPSLWE